MATEEKLREYLKRATVDLTEARRRLQETEDGQHEPLAIIGMACRYPGGATVEDYWELLRTGGSGVVEVPAERWDVDQHYNADRRVVGGVYTKHGAFLDDIAGWDAEFFGISPHEALRMDPHQRLLMELVCEGLDNAGLAASRVAGSRTGVLVGLMDSSQYGRLQIEKYGQDVVRDPYFGQGVAPSVIAGRLAYQFDLRGPAITLDTACSSSLVAVHLAAQALRRGDCDLAVAAGAYLIMHPDTYVQTCATSMLAADGRCKTFDSDADGYVLGEGAGLVVLQRLSDALREGSRIRAVLLGSAVNQDGHSNGLSAPSRGAQVQVIRQALADARLDPDEVDYVEAHGTGTRLGDAIELSALHDVFGGRSPRRPLHVGAVKTNIGHTQSAAGVAGLIKTVLLLEHGQAPTNLNTDQPATAVPQDGTIQPLTSSVWLPEGGRSVAGVSGFGWSGTNAHLVVRAAPAQPADQPEPAADQPEPAADRLAPAAYALPVSGASEAALRAQLTQLADRLAEQPELALADVAHTLSTGRTEHDYRRALVCTDTADAVGRLAAAVTGSAAGRARSRPRVAFLLAGVGDEYAGLGRELHAGEPVFAAAVDECMALLEQRSGVDLAPMFFPRERQLPAAGDLAALLGRTGDQPSAEPGEHAEVSHPFMFTVEYALARLLAHRGVRPHVLVGYSLGEYVAACLAGVFTLSDALYLVVERARLIAAAPAGRMLSVAAGEDAVRAVIADSDADVDIAAINGPSMTVLSGLAGPIEQIGRLLTAGGIACQPLRTAHAFHSSLLEPARDKLAALVDSVPRQAPSIPIVSNRAGVQLTDEQATSPQHWADHLVNPVRFADSVRHCQSLDVEVFLELGAGQTLGGLARQNLSGSAGTALLGTLPARWTAQERPDEQAELLATCAQLWELGVPVDWTATRAPGARIVTLPSYPFQRTRFWPESDAGQPTQLTQPAPAAAEPADLCYAPAWRQDDTGPLPKALPLPGPLVIFADRDGIGSALAELAAAAGTPVLEVHPGEQLRRDGRQLVIDPREPAHYREVFSALAGQGPVRVVHLWSLLGAAASAGYAGDEELLESIRHGYDTLLLAIQNFGELPAGDGVALLTVSRGGVEVLGNDVPAPHRAAVHGLARVAQHEYAGLSWRGVDIDPEPVGARLAAAHLAAELLHEQVEPYSTMAAWRRARRWLQDWATVATPETGEPVWRADGVYLITGGTRGLGLSLARRLVGLGVRRFALVSRGSHSPTVETESPEGSTANPNDRAAATSRALAELRAAGAEVLLLSADVGVPAELREALRRCREHFGALHGVVHAAGAPASGMVARQSVAGAGAVLAPKVLAMGPLAELVGPGTPAELRPELLVLYSSAITVFGGIGEGDYCAANAVLDSYGAALAASAPSTRVVTVGWGPWQHDDWQASGRPSGLAERAGAYRKRFGFTDEAGCAFLDRLVRTGRGSVVAVRQPMQDSIRDWGAMLDIDALVGAGSAAPPGQRFPRPRLRTEYVAARTELEIVIAEVWQAYLGIDQVGVHDPFFDLGGNSLVGMAMVHAVESKLDAQIAPAVLFEHPTIAEFAAALERTDAHDDTVAELLTTSSDRGQRRRRARSGTRK
ncbi:MAG TPA: beta-ketoacyl synthase N-terminal-like domain-containing protein [Jatrophihabitans sp.]|uniref:beta-ketoacyl synthase N-terminal-like domain-containing protein n=1 Tax=Jatrophihabitans sp. TaxID=1932789 RepID=UPI002F1F30B2